MPLRDALGSAESRRRHVRKLFSTIADRYDLITVVLSFGMDRRWKRRAIRLAGAAPAHRALDLACGTGDLAFALAAGGSQVIGLDVTRRMLQLAAGKRRMRPGPAFVQADMMALPFADAQFDIVTTGYGLRNVPELVPAVDEIHRVLRPGGTLVSLDFNNPEGPFVRAVYLSYLSAVGGLLGRALHGDPDTYRYIPASIRRYPGAPLIVRLLRERGFADAAWIPVLGGLMALHVARRAQDAGAPLQAKG